MALTFIDLAAQQRRIKPQIDAALQTVLSHGAYVMGPEVRSFEKQLSAFCGAGLSLSCANGTDAIALPLAAWEICTGDAVFCPSFTFAATPEVVPWTGAEPVFVDILPDTYNLDPVKLEAAIIAIQKEGRLKPKVIIAVDLFGQPADYPSIYKIAERYGLKLIADSAQGFGCTLGGKHPIHWADVVTTSFFPAKPLGCYGDGGAVLTDDADFWSLMDSYRVHGKAVDCDLNGRVFEHDPKYLNARIGMNSRLDTIQAAILIEKLKIFADELEARQKVADRYAEGLAGFVKTPVVIEGGVSTWAQYTIQHDHRDGLASHLRTKGIPTAIYYPIPMHQQAPYVTFPTPGGLPVTEAASRHVISLPMHPYLETEMQDLIIDAVLGFNG